jgi:hypothetical protein
VHHGLRGDGKAVVLNHLEETPRRRRLAIPGASAASAVVHRPGQRPEEVRLPAELSLGPDEVAVVVFR